METRKGHNETELHYNFKMAAADVMAMCHYIPFEWKCKDCGGTHSGDLLKRGKRIEVEKHVGKYRPDISIWNGDKCVCALEIVVTSKPSFSAARFYKENNIPLVICKLGKSTCIDDILGTLSTMETDLCLAPVCDKHKVKHTYGKMIRCEEYCTKCKEKYYYPLVYGVSGIYQEYITLRDMDSDMIAASEDICVKVGVSKYGTKAPLCPHCDWAQTWHCEGPLAISNNRDYYDYDFCNECVKERVL